MKQQPVALVMENEEVELLIPLYDLEISGTKNFSMGGIGCEEIISCDIMHYIMC